MPEFSTIPEQQKKILEYIMINSQITSAQVEELLDVKERRARAILNDMVKASLIQKQGRTKNTKYLLKV